MEGIKHARGFCFKVLLTVLLLVSLSACAGMGGFNMPHEGASGPQLGGSTAWLADGTITLARSAPAPKQISQTTMLGFLPGTIPALAAPAERIGTWISIDRSQKKLTLFDGSATIGSYSGEGFDKLPAGAFHLMLKQRNPLWYAPDTYFTTRNLAVPSPGDRSRFRRGALGDFAIFLDKTTAMHSGPVWSSDIGGLRMEENDLSRIYYQLDVGSLIEVK